MAEPLERRAMGFIVRVRRLVAIWRWGPRDVFLAFAGFSALATGTALRLGLGRLVKEGPLEISKSLEPWLPLPFWLAGGLCLGWAALRIYRRVTAPVPEDETKLPALKGAASFAPEDADLFAQLGRGAELEQLRAWILDDQKPLLVLMGESGVGKTSLLRAGLAHALKADAPQPIYWEALPTQPASGLLHAVRTAWGKAKGAPADLAALPAAIAGSPRVVVLDQFEQLSPEHDPDVFKLLEDVLYTPPPYRGTWIVAFRREYAATWLEFTLRFPEGVRHRIETLSLTRFSVATARRIVAVLATAAKLPVLQQVVDSLVDDLTVDGRVSPVDLGVTLLGLRELAPPDGNPLSLGGFRASGGPVALLTLYLERQLALVAPGEQSQLLSALLALIDLGRNQRVAAGLTLTQLIAKARPGSPTRFEAALGYLASGKARVLELLADRAGVPRYRLIHERFIEPVRMLSGTILAEAAEAALRLDEAYSAWAVTRRRGLLLVGRELRIVLRHQREFSWGEDEAGKREFVRLSKQRRRSRFALAAVVSFSLVTLDGVAHEWQLQQEKRLTLRSSDLPQDLESYLDQLDTLEVGATVRSFDWLKDASQLHSLSVHAQLDATSTLPSNLKELTCWCSNSGLLRLPTHLQTLKVIQTDHSASVLPVLPADLQTLSLVGGSSSTLSLEPFERGLPRALSTLDLIDGPAITDPSHLPPGLRSLALTVGDLDELQSLPPGLTELKLRVPAWSLADHLEQLPRTLVSLTVGFPQEANSPHALPFLDFRQRLTLREISLPTTRVTGFALPSSLISLSYFARPLQDATFPLGLRSLMIYNVQPSDLKRLPASLESLTLIGGGIESWEELPLHLRSLTLIAFPPPRKLPQELQSLSLLATALPKEGLPSHLRMLASDWPWRDLKSRLPSTLRTLDVSHSEEMGLPRLGGQFSVSSC
jgi:hypothetical protein